MRLLVGGAVLLLLAGLTVPVALATVDVGGRGENVLAQSYRTTVYNVRGKALYTLVGNCDVTAEYCTSVRGPRSRVIYVSLTHNTCGGAVRVSETTWKAWIGRRFVGTVVKRSAKRADIFSRSGQKQGYAIGALPVRAGAFDLIVGNC